MNLGKTLSFQPSLEILEDRRVLNSATLNAGLLTVNGTGGGDVIIIKNVLGRIHVSGVARSFKASSVTQISADAMAGNDRVEIRPTVPKRITSTVLGGTGNDTLFGGAGNDSIFGDDGDDIIRGGAGADTLIGAIGNDTVRGDNGADLLDGGDPVLHNDPTGADLLNGGHGPDTLLGGSANDTLNGSFGADVLDGSTGNDLLNGGFGNDFLDGGSGNDALNGGVGFDSGTNGEVVSHIP